DFVRGRQISTIIAVDVGGARRYVGRCGIRINTYALSGDIGYWVDGEFEGRGIVRRSSRALISSAIDELGLTRMELRTSIGNVRSRALAERLGFTLQSILPNGLRFVHRSDDVAFYSVSADRWKALQTSEGSITLPAR